ncbi:helix-turn-helix transcriptional regulator, partial [Novosphingobium aquimarinum]|uniref:helix-turn-helix transcriptional regulator n=1 Tax=Novosphingobium aquimarinum TaxID=2682494 RepID=UPI0018DE447C
CKSLIPLAAIAKGKKWTTFTPPAAALRRRYRGLILHRRSQKVPSLTDRQRECLLWVARGKTAAETAMILEISTETVIQHLKMARERYQVHCKQSLVVAALFDGLIGFADIIRWRDTG